MPVTLTRKGYLVLVFMIFLSLTAVKVVADIANLPVPYYQQENERYCGPACAQMWIKYRTGIKYSQDQLYAFIQEHNLEPWNTDPHGLADCLNNYIPGHYYHDIKWSYPYDAVTSEGVHIIYYSEPSAAVTYGHIPRCHWMLVKGCEYAHPPPILILGFYIHDPWYMEGSLGGDAYVSAIPWVNNYFTRINVPGSQWNGYWVDVEDPSLPKINVNVTLFVESGVGPLDSGEQAIQVAVKGLETHNLTKASSYGRYLNGAKPSNAIYVRSLHATFPNYYIVPFVREDKTTAAVIVDADQGLFMGCSYADPPLAKYPKLSMEEAIEAVKNYIKSDCLIYSAELVWKPSVQAGFSPYTPVWMVYTDGETFYVNQDGEVTNAL